LLGHSDLTNLGTAYPQGVQQNKQSILRHFAEGVNGNNGVATDLQRLMAVRSVFERTLIYVRYGAKALEASQ
jgi:hypothetical protein